MMLHVLSSVGAKIDHILVYLTLWAFPIKRIFLAMVSGDERENEGNLVGADKFGAHT
jgi:hypothetical protein